MKTLLLICCVSLSTVMLSQIKDSINLDRIIIEDDYPILIQNNGSTVFVSDDISIGRKAKKGFFDFSWIEEEQEEYCKSMFR